MGREKMGISDEVRDEYDFYATNPKDVIQIVDILKLDKNSSILEPCTGNGHIAKTLQELGYFYIWTNDLIERDFPLFQSIDFLNMKLDVEKFDIVIMNPPFKLAKEFIIKALEYSDKVVVIARLDLLESKKRKEINNKYLEHVYVHTKRARFAKGGIEELFKKSTSMSTAWFVYNKNKVGLTQLEAI